MADLILGLPGRRRRDNPTRHLAAARSIRTSKSKFNQTEHVVEREDDDDRRLDLHRKRNCREHQWRRPNDRAHEVFARRSEHPQGLAKAVSVSVPVV